MKTRSGSQITAYGFPGILTKCIATNLGNAVPLPRRDNSACKDGLFGHGSPHIYALVVTAMSNNANNETT
jgi:hypothetical protein